MNKIELVTTLKRNATKIIASLTREKQAILITQHGHPAAYLVDVETFEALHARMRLLEGIAKGEMAVREGRILSHEQAKLKMKRWL